MCGWSTRVIGERKTKFPMASHTANPYSFVVTFAVLHLMVFIFGMVNYGFKVRLLVHPTIIFDLYQKG